MGRKAYMSFPAPRHMASYRRTTGAQLSTTTWPNVSDALDKIFAEGSQSSSNLGRLRREEHQVHTPGPEALSREDNLQFDAFTHEDPELLAQSDESTRARQSVFSATDSHHFYTRQPISGGTPDLASRYSRGTDDSHITPQRSLTERSFPRVEQASSSRRQQQDNQTRPEHFEELPPPARYGTSVTTTVEHKTPFENNPVSIRGIVLVSVQELPDKYRSLFHFPVFNAVRSKCFQPVYKRDNNIVLAAPTGSGKTVVMELAICRVLNNLKDERFKVIYQAPTKSLCSERFRDWNRKFHSLGLQCAELTGDTDFTQMGSVQNSQIIITTPENWDSMTRKWKDHARLMQLVKLFLIDEVHILKESRGATLEAVVSRMKTIGSNVRFVALSATIPNSEGIATWLGKDATNQHVPAHREHFGEEFLPVKLQRFVYGYQSQGNDFVFDKMCSSRLPDVLAMHSCRKPIMIFCCTSNSSVATAKELARLWSMSNPPARLWKGPSKLIEVNNVDLKTTTAAGVAFHHACLDPADRHAIETGFSQGQISIICCTSTLEVGVNLPCYLVIVKNTVGWMDGGCKEYSDLDIMQMLGQRNDYYERLVSGSESPESCLHLNLMDHLNAEIGLGSVTSIESAIRWLAGTFLFVRMRRNPTHYQLREGADREDEDEMLRQICEKDVKPLQESGLVSTECLRSIQFGDAMARYYVRFETMKTFLALKRHATMSQILSAVSQAEEYRDVRLKAGEKSSYREINRGTGILFPVKVDIALPAHKTSLLIQCELGALDFPDGEQFQKHKFAFQQDKSFVFSHINRLIRCIIDCQISLEDSIAAKNALELARSFAAKVWDSSPFHMKQIAQIGVAIRKLAAARITSIVALEHTEPHKIDMILSKNPPFGMKLLGRLCDFPKLRVSVKMVKNEGKHGAPVRIHFKAEVAFVNEKCPTSFQRHPVHTCFLAETSDGFVIDFRRMSASKVQSIQEITLKAEIKTQDQYITCYAKCDDIAELRPALAASLFSIRWNDMSDDMGQKYLINMSHPRSNTSSRMQLTTGHNLGFFRKATDWAVMGSITSPLSEQKPQRKLTGKSKESEQVELHKSEEPTQLENGRWSCNYKCKNKTMSKHLCCREGLEKPPRVNRKQSTGEINQSNRLNQLTISASITKSNVQIANSNETRAVKGNITEAGPQSVLQGPSEAPDVNLRNHTSRQNTKSNPLCFAVENKDSSSDYGEDNFNDFPSPSALLLGNNIEIGSPNAQSTNKEDSLNKDVQVKDNWTYADEPWLTLLSSFTGPLVQDNDAMSTSTQTRKKNIIKPRVYSPIDNIGTNLDGESTKEMTDIGHIDGDKRKFCLTGGDEICDERDTKKHKNASTSFVNQGQCHGTVRSQNHQPYEADHSSAIWDDIDPTLLDESKDIVNFF
ncbi:Sec63 Brl domain-containing protein [Aspergillus alliaceus]|uniref:DNA 3'-5' helicase n=1 Tax=Petromyces alliaceus TaxID=209559 RepID=A0A5N7BYI7_PETAA|nr:Sec63 Brl domain-containing protein [Aspergillus alliaceus]